MKNARNRFTSLFIAVTLLFTVTCFTACNSESVPSVTTNNVTEEITTTTVSTSAVTSVPIESTTTESITTTTTSSTESPIIPEHHIDFETVKYDEYNNKGCELPATCALLNFYGIEITPSKLFEYIPVSSVSTPASDILWYTWDTSSCYSPVIEIALQGVFVDYEITDKTVVNYLSKINLNELLTTYIDADIPVLIWSTINMNEPVFKTDYTSDGSSFEYTNDAQCYIITGYTEDVIEAYEPYYGKIKEYPRDVFIQRYEDMFSQAIVIEEIN